MSSLAIPILSASCSDCSVVFDRGHRAWHSFLVALALQSDIGGEVWDLKLGRLERWGGFSLGRVTW